MIGRTIVKKMNPIVVEFKKRSVLDTDSFYKSLQSSSFLLIPFKTT